MLLIGGLEDMNKSGIYCVRNITNNKVYIGSACSNRGFTRRWHEHRKELNRNIHANKHLQNAYNKYGANSFEFGVVEECLDDVLEARETYWIAYYNAMSKEHGYNMRLPKRKQLEKNIPVTFEEMKYWIDKMDALRTDIKKQVRAERLAGKYDSDIKKSYIEYFI